MARRPAPGPALAALAGETRAGFDWLAAGLDPAVPVSFVPNPGNLGDAAINLACWRWLAHRFREVELCPLYGPGQRAPSHRTVFVGGGGNFVEPLYRDVSDLLLRLPLTHQVRLFPVTAYGYDGALIRWRGRIRMLCRERISYHFARRRLGSGARLGHDAAFSLAGELPGAEAAGPGEGSLRYLRLDRESVREGAAGDGDPSAAQIEAWGDPAEMEAAVAGFVAALARPQSIATDRLHVAIVGALLGRRVELQPNSYYKNGAVYAHSLRRLPQASFATPACRRAAPEVDPQLFRRLQAPAETAAGHGLRRLWPWLGERLAQRGNARPSPS